MSKQTVNGNCCDGGESINTETSERIPTDIHNLQYTVEENPPWMFCILLGFQHYVSMFLATLTIPFLLAPKICIDEDHVGKSHLIGTLFVASGIITLLQTCIGVRLPIVQAGTFALLAPTLAFFSLPEWECPDIGPPVGYNMTSSSNISFIEVGSEEHREIWMLRLRVVQGSLMVAAMFEALLGLTGAVGVLLRYIGPLSICPTISLLGLSLFKPAAAYGAKQWWICIFTLFLMVLFSQYLGQLKLPCLSYKKSRGCYTSRYPIFKMFPVILAIGLAWLLCIVLTEANVFPQSPEGYGYGARTDIRSSVIMDAPWFRMPYPCQWGMPMVSVACMCGLMAGLIATTVESVGDYIACANLSGAPPPPVHAVNRGIFVEGLGSFLDGLFGTGNGTTSTSINVGVIGITKVGSRRVVQVSAVFMVVLGVFNKFGAVFVTIPDPVIGGSFIILFGMIVAVGLSNLQYIDLNSSRNLFILGFSFLVGLSIPEWMKNNPGAINTGSATFDSAMQVLMSTSMFLGGFLGFVLDNTIPGTQEERGLHHFQKVRSLQDPSQCTEDLQARLRGVYDIPYVSDYMRSHNVFSYIPICPSFVSHKLPGKRHSTTEEETVRLDDVTV